MWAIEDGIKRNLETKRIIEEARDNPEKLWELLKSYIDEYVWNGDIVWLNMLMDFIQWNLETVEHRANYSKRNIDLRNDVAKALKESKWESSTN